MAYSLTTTLVAFLLASTFFAEARLLSYGHTPTPFSYHGGPLLHGPLPLHILWYGSFSPTQQSIITDFISSFQPAHTLSSPSIPQWWATISLYSPSPLSSPPLPLLGLQATISNPSLSLGFSLNKSSLPALLQQALASNLLPTSPKSIYLILTSQDVTVEDFCMGTCGLHAHMEVMMRGRSSSAAAGTSKKLAYMWVGNAARQCPGECAWPFAAAAFGPQEARLPLGAPNRDVGIEGMVINLATLLAGIVTNPFKTGFYVGDVRVPLEAGSACTGLFGEGAFPGFPGRLLVSNSTGASFNVHGTNNRTFLLPALWDPAISKCITLP